jgi:hypothetical protein
MTNSSVVYSALVYTAVAPDTAHAQHYELEFPQTPTLHETLVALNWQILLESKESSPLVLAAANAIFVSGHEHESFNESGLFQFRENDNSWIRVWCPANCCDSQIVTENWL